MKTTFAMLWAGTIAGLMLPLLCTAQEPVRKNEEVKSTTEYLIPRLLIQESSAPPEVKSPTPPPPPLPPVPFPAPTMTTSNSIKPDPVPVTRPEAPPTVAPEAIPGPADYVTLLSKPTAGAVPVHVAQSQPCPCPKPRVGCLTFFHDRCATIPAGAMPMPRGYYLNRWNKAMATKAEEGKYVIYGHEWYMGGTVLGPNGSRHLAEIIRRLDQVPFQVMIQTDGVQQLDEARRQAIITLLSQHGIKDAEARVKIGYARAEGLRFNEDYPKNAPGRTEIRGSVYCPVGVSHPPYGGGK